MGDAYKKVQTGQPLAIPAEAYNAFIDAASDFQSRQRSRTQDAKQGFRQTGIVRLKNESGSDRDRFAVLGVDGPIISPDDNLDSFRNEVTLVGVVPASEDHTGRYAILLEPIRTGGIGSAVVAGVAIVKVDVKEECHAFAEIAGGQTTHLQSGTKGSAVILWKETGSGVKWAVVRIAGPELMDNSCDDCSEKQGSCAFEARFVSGGGGKTEWVRVENSCGEDFTCHEPDQPPTADQANVGEWTRTCCEARDPGCGASCSWIWDGAAWVLDENPCPESCPCESPPPRLAGSTGSTTKTPCGGSPTGGNCPEEKIPEPTPECVGETCGDKKQKCQWKWERNEEDLPVGILLNPGVCGECCSCQPVESLCFSPATIPCGIVLTDCRPKHGADSLNGCCGSSCRLYWSFSMGRWVEGIGTDNECFRFDKGRCHCDTNKEPPPPGADICSTPQLRSTCTSFQGCYGGCDWSWNGSAWELASSECPGECVCRPPGGEGSSGEVARSCCLPPTTTTTTTTTIPNCCDIFGEDPYITVCSDSNKVTLRPQEDGAWTGVTLLPCGDQFGARVECSPSPNDDCSGFRLKFNMPCASPPIFDGTIVECHCAEYQNLDAPDPKYLFTWINETADLSGCGCCGNFDPSTTTTAPG